jgi:signal transduction histidine kinase
MNEELIKYLDILYGQINVAVQVLDKSGKVIYINPEFTIVWDYNLDELKEYNIFSDAELKNSKALEIVNQALRDKKTGLIMNYSDSLLKSKQITKPILKTRVFPIEIDSQEFVVLYHEDETEIILVQKEFEKVNDANKEMERLKNNFLNVLSHELRTPLNIILGYSSILRESVKDKINTEEKIYLDNLNKGGERLFKSITQMLEFAQIETENYKMEIKKISLNKLLENGFASVKSLLEEKEIKVNLNLSKDEIFINADQQFAENAINNLLSNAIKFTNRGFIDVETEIVEDRDVAICKIKDSGVGISSKYMDHLFQPFSQEDLNIGRNYEGNGLGLVLSKKYIERLGGSLLVDSIKGVGTTVTFTLPLSDNNQSSVAEKNGAKSLLMLDETSDSHELINAYLKRQFTLDIKDPYDFNYDILSKKDYRAILFDVYQSRWDEGIFLCREIKHKDMYSRPIIIISSEFEGNKIREFYEAGADKFLVKPFSKHDLLKSLEELKV